MELTWDDIVIDKRDVRANAPDLMKNWLWLVPAGAEPMLPTACGDVFLRLADGGIALLDTYAGACDVVAPDYDQWKAMLGDTQRMDEWFKIGLVADLLDAGLKRQPGDCFSPFVPQIVNGSWERSNFHTCSLLVHLASLGQIHRQVKDLPPGTEIRGFNVRLE